MKKLAKDCFAFPQHQRYPIHTKQAALQSYKAYTAQKYAFTQTLRAVIQQNFAKAASVHQITLTQQQGHTVRRKVASVQCGNTHVDVSMPMNTKEALQMALNIEDMSDNKGYSAKQLRKLASIAVQWAAELQEDQETMQKLLEMPIMQKIARIAGLGFGNKQDICSEFLKRANYIEMDKSAKKAFVDTYNGIKGLDQQEFLKSATLNTICDTMQDIDTRFDLKKHYGKQLRRPIDVCYDTTAAEMCKQASDLVKIASTGTILSKKALFQRKQRVEAFFQQHFDKKVQNQQDLLEKTANLAENYVNSFLEFII